jgi:hypothetical protein
MGYDECMEQASVIKEKYEALKPYMDKRMRRVWAAAEAKALGRGGISTVSEATGLTRKTIRGGLCEQQEQLESGEAPGQRVRRRGGGRKRITEQDPNRQINYRLQK